MTLIKSISGIRGTMGGRPGDGLTPLDAVRFASAYGAWICGKHLGPGRPSVVIGRDARVSGQMISSLVSGSLMGMGIDVTDLGLSTTPTVEMAVTMLKASGGIILTASHNPAQWNALKLLNHHGEFISEQDGRDILTLAEKDDFIFAGAENTGTCVSNGAMLDWHIKKILELPYVNAKAVSEANLRVVVDPVNSSGAIAVPALLNAMGVKDVVVINGEPNGIFAHDPEPLPKHLEALSAEVVKRKASIGISVDPDVDRLAIVCEDGSMFGEEYTLVAVADFVLKSRSKGNTVSNLSSTRALRDVTEKHGGSYFASAVGEVNVVAMMKENKAVIGGEGNGGVIVPELHYGRDALAGIAIFLTSLVSSEGGAKALRNTFPEYKMSKNKIELAPGTDVERILIAVKEKYRSQPVNAVDGIKIEFEKGWVHLRKSNTEPVVRIYSEGESAQEADALAGRLMSDISELMSELKT